MHRDDSSGPVLHRRGIESRIAHDGWAATPQKLPNVAPADCFWSAIPLSLLALPRELRISSKISVLDAQTAPSALIDAKGLFATRTNKFRSSPSGQQRVFRVALRGASKLSWGSSRGS